MQKKIGEKKITETPKIFLLHSYIQIQSEQTTSCKSVFWSLKSFLYLFLVQDVCHIGNLRVLYIEFILVSGETP